LVLDCDNTHNTTTNNQQTTNHYHTPDHTTGRTHWFVVKQELALTPPRLPSFFLYQHPKMKDSSTGTCRSVIKIVDEKIERLDSCCEEASEKFNSHWYHIYLTMVVVVLCVPLVFMPMDGSVPWMQPQGPSFSHHARTNTTVFEQQYRSLEEVKEEAKKCDTAYIPKKCNEGDDYKHCEWTPPDCSGVGCCLSIASSSPAPAGNATCPKTSDCCKTLGTVAPGFPDAKCNICLKGYELKGQYCSKCPQFVDSGFILSTGLQLIFGILGFMVVKKIFKGMVTIEEGKLDINAAKLEVMLRYVQSIALLTLHFQAGWSTYFLQIFDVFATVIFVDPFIVITVMICNAQGFWTFYGKWYFMNMFGYTWMYSYLSYRAMKPIIRKYGKTDAHQAPGSLKASISVVYFMGNTIGVS